MHLCSDSVRRRESSARVLDRIELTNSKQDPCVEDVLRCAVAQAEHPALPKKWKDWWTWTPWRGLSAGELPPPLAKALPSRRR